MKFSFESLSAGARYAGCLVVLLLANLGFAGAASAQEPDTLMATILSCFEEKTISTERDTPCALWIPTVEEIIRSPERFPRRTVAAVIDGLERLALTSDRWQVRRFAVGLLKVAGLPGGPGSGRPLPGSVERLASIFWGSSNSSVRHGIVRGMAQQADRKIARDFLKTVVLAAQQREPEEDREPPAYRALVELELMGAEGRNALQELHAGGQVKNEQARALLDYLAIHSFGESIPADCPPRRAGNPRVFDPSYPEVLIGRYEVIMVSEWDDDDGMMRRGALELWSTDSLRCCYNPEYLRIADSVVGEEHYARFDYDSIIRWSPLPGHYKRNLYGAMNIDLRSMTLGTKEGLDRLSSRDPEAPGLLGVGNRLELAPARLGFFVLHGATTRLEVDSLSDGGFWGDWLTDYDLYYMIDDTGQDLPDPHGHFCAIKKDE